MQNIFRSGDPWNDKLNTVVLWKGFWDEGGNVTMVQTSEAAAEHEHEKTLEKKVFVVQF